MQSIKPRPLRDEVRDLVLDHLLAGHLPAGRSVGETALADALGVSRTPLREALMALERDGFVRCHRGRGFVVCPLTATEVREIYPIVWTLEQLAVRTGPIDHDVLEALDRSSNRLAEARSDRVRVRRDSEWHTRLVTRSNNERLVSMLASVRSRITRYEIVYMRQPIDVESSVDEHLAITAALRGGDREQAAQRIEQHWRQGMQIVLDQMKQTTT